QGKHVSIGPGEFSRKVDKCDTTINKIRNSALDNRLFSDLDEAARREIGYDDQKFKSTIRNEHPTERQTVTLCHDDFRTAASHWFGIQADNINEIKKGKIARLDEIRGDSPKVDNEYIKSFLNDYSSCETDQTAILVLITNHPDDFLAVCKEMADTDFFTLTLKLSPMPDNMKARDAVHSLEASEI